MMTETQWLSAITPRPMLQHVRSRASARKLQLIAVAAWRQIARHFDDPGMSPLVELVGRQAEGEVSLSDWQEAVRVGERYGLEAATLFGNSPAVAARLALRALVSGPPPVALAAVLLWAEACAARAAGPGQQRSTVRVAQRAQADLFREILGNPFQERTIAPEWMTTGGGIIPGWTLRISETAKALADGIQADQAFERLPILADALEESGCTDTELLAHLREPGRHVRGCWALDLVLGKG